MGPDLLLTPSSVCFRSREDESDFLHRSDAPSLTKRREHCLLTANLLTANLLT